MNTTKTTPILLLALSAASLAVAKDTKPNVIIIFADDQGYQDLGCYGSPNIKTPNIDAMAGRGVRFTDFYVSATVSSASRAGLLTGKHNNRNGVKGVFFPHENGMSPNQVTIAEALKEHNYKTACFGKWHLGDALEQMPLNQGFDTYLGIPYSNDMWISSFHSLAKDVKLNEGKTLEQAKADQALTKSRAKMENVRSPLRCLVPLVRDTEVVEYPVDQSTTTKRYFDQAIDFISDAKKNPFFVYITPAMPHWPLYASADFKGKSERGTYGDVVEEIDFHVGRLLKMLKDKKLDKNTLVIYASDNGPSLKYKLEGGTALPLKGGKFSLYDGGVRVPCVMQWTGTIPSGVTSDAIISSLDFFPTIMQMVGDKTERDFDGKGQLEFLKDPKDASKSARDTYYYIKDGKVGGVRHGDWKYLKIKDKETLTNLRKDIGEKKNLAESNPDKVAELKALMQKAVVKK